MTTQKVIDIIKNNASICEGGEYKLTVMDAVSAMNEILANVLIVDSVTVGKSIENYGSTIQTVVAMEECSELIQVASKLLRGKHTEQAHLCEEMADVYISLEILKQIYKIETRDIQGMIRKKEARTMERMSNGE